MHRFIAFLALLIVLPSFAAESPSVGKVTGSVVDQATKPIEYATVAVKSRADFARLLGRTTPLFPGLCAERKRSARVALERFVVIRGSGVLVRFPLYSPSSGATHRWSSARLPAIFAW